MGGSAVSLKASAAETIAALQKDIQNARYSIEMEFYIWEEGGSVDVIIDALFAARRRGVSVRLLVDDFGSRNFLRSNARRDLEAAGVEIASAMPMRLLQSSIFSAPIYVFIAKQLSSMEASPIREAST